MKRLLKGIVSIGKGALDIAAIPNIHDLIKGARKRNPTASTGELIVDIAHHTDWPRMITSVVLMYGVFAGHITIENAKEILTLLTDLL